MGYTRQQKERGENGLRPHLRNEGLLLCLDFEDPVLDGVLGDELKHAYAGEWLASSSLRGWVGKTTKRTALSGQFG